jgi:hypothetical protein
MTDVEFNKERAILKTWRVQGHGFLQRNSDKSPLASVIGANTVGNKKSLLEHCMMDRVKMLSRGNVGVKYVGAEGGDPVYMTGRVEIVSPKR